MRWSEFFLPTVKETPSEAEIISHKLMLRAGLIRKLSAGVYNLLPLGLRVSKKVENIVREEMNRAGGLEILMPVLGPAELWQETGRWDVYGKELMRLKDRHDRFFALGPTHEEIVTDIVRHEVRSYRQLPLVLYQIQTKFRDEVRPRFGVVRAREFIMKDAYSFHCDEADLQKTYDKMYEAYSRIFKRCGLRFGPVEADSGAIGGDVTHEFMVFAETGESQVFACDCGFAATVDRADGEPPAHEFDRTVKPLEKMATPGKRTVEEVTAFLGKQPWELVKTMIYNADGSFVAALVRGDREINEVKLNKILGAVNLVMATPEEIQQVTGGPLGFSGPVGLKNIRIIADRTVTGMTNMVVGANEVDAHLVNANLGRDFEISEVHDLVLTVEGDKCRRCGRPLKTWRGIEVGQIFKLGTKYSEKMKAYFLDQHGAEKPFVMGCYGIGITRTVAAAIEQHNDADGIVWPVSIAPFEVHVLPTNVSDSDLRTTAEAIHADLVGRGIEVLIDDRDERPGAKFKDADLVGIPFRVTVGEKAAKEGKVEIRTRKTGETVKIARGEAADRAQQLVLEEKRKLAA
ncbi:MAG TPA: proline--tRNA ligase [bacterium]|nr:proline--tRNA ligase [bacterium]